jgi:hypothetical protein
MKVNQSKETKKDEVHWRKLEPSGAAEHLGRPASPFILPPSARLPQESHSSSSQFVFLCSKSKTSRNIASHFEL